MKSILTMAWTAEDPAAFDLAARLARSFGAKLVGPRYAHDAVRWPKMPESVFETALFDSGRPVLVVPQGFSGMVGKRILFAWNGSTESARAISLAMPVLSGAESIDVLSVDGAMVPGPSSAEIAESLRSHGLNVTSQHVKPGSRTAGQTIVDTAIAGGADLIVKGAYTQSRLRQMIFGGMTRHLILSSPLPVLFSY